MKKLYPILSSIAAAAMFTACSEDSNSSTPNTAGGAIEDTNFIAEGISSSSDGTVQSSNSQMNKSDKAYVDSILASYGPHTYSEDSNPDWYYSEEDDEWYCSSCEIDSAELFIPSPVEYNFTTKRESLFEKYWRGENRENASCAVSLFREENGFRKIKGDNANTSFYYVLQKENEGSHFVQYMEQNFYDFDAAKACIADSLAMIDFCKKNNGVVSSYATHPCNDPFFAPDLEMICIVKTEGETSLDSLAKPFVDECDEYMAQYEN